MAKLPPRDDDEVRPRNKRRYDPPDPGDGKPRERDMPRKTGGRPLDEDDDWEEDWDLDDDDDLDDEDWNDGDLDPDDEDDDR